MDSFNNVHVYIPIVNLKTKQRWELYRRKNEKQTLNVYKKRSYLKDPDKILAYLSSLDGAGVFY